MTVNETAFEIKNFFEELQELLKRAPTEDALKEFDDYVSGHEAIGFIHGIDKYQEALENGIHSKARARVEKIRELRKFIKDENEERAKMTRRFM